jgi:hypothetical protein
VNIADIQASVTLFLETGAFESEAAKAGDSAGSTMGASMSAKIKTSLSNLIGAGIGLEIGKQVVHGFETAVSDIANVLPGMFQSGQAFALNIEDITKKTGASAETASRFAGTLTYLGQSTEGLGQMLKTLSVQVVSNEAQFTKLGIVTRDGNGNLLDSITILNNLRSYLSTAGDGATKLALATHLLGRSAGNLIEYLDLTDAQAAKLNETMDALGVTISEKAVTSAEGAARESNLLSLAWQGFSNVLMTEVAPTVRQVLGAAFQFIVDHGAEVRQTLIDITNAALGLITGLLGIEGVTPFQTQLDALSGSASNVTLSFDEWAQQMGYTVPKITAATGATKTNTTAIDAQIASLKVLDTQQAKTYTDGLAGLNAQLDAQGKLMDAQDQAVQRAETAANLQRSLRDATEALAKAQLDAQTALATAASDATLSPQAKAQAQIDAANTVRSAEEALSQARQAIADNARTMTEQDRKAQIQSVKDELTAIDKIVSDAGVAGGSSKTALADLEKRRKALATGGAPATGSDSAIELQAVLAAEKRIRQQDANTTKQDALDAAKAQASAAGAVQTSANAATLATLKAQYAAYLAQQKADTATHILSVEEIISGNPKSGTGLGGAFTKSFADGQAAGEEFRSWLENKLLPSVSGVVGAVSAIGSAISDIHISATAQTAIGIAVMGFGATSGNLGLIVAGAGMAGLNIGNVGTEYYKSIGVAAPPSLFSGQGPFASNPGIVPAHAAGGFIPPLTWGMTGERGPEPVYGGSTGATVLPNSALDGQPAIIRLEIGGRPLLDYVDQGLAYRRRR